MNDFDPKGDASSVPPNANRPTIRPTVQPLPPNDLGSGRTGRTVTNDCMGVMGIYRERAREGVRPDARVYPPAIGILPSYPSYQAPKALQGNAFVVGRLSVLPISARLCDKCDKLSDDSAGQTNSLSSLSLLVEQPAQQPIPCLVCSCPLFWQSIYNSTNELLRCYECEPPPVPAMIRQRWMVVVDVEAEEHAWELARGRDEWQDVEDRDAENWQPQQRQHPQRRPGPGRLIRELQSPALNQSFGEWWDSLADQTERVLGQLQRRRDERELANRLY